MQALINTTNQYGKVIFEPKGWRVAISEVPTIFTDAITIEQIDSLSHGSASSQGFQLIHVNVTPI